MGNNHTVDLFAARSADRFVRCRAGHQHWGRFGAAGVLLANGGQVLLAKRSARTHQGNTWSTPGGAIQPGEAPLAAALRELAEETAITLIEPVELLAEHLDDHGGWSYLTYVIAAPVSATDRAELQWETTQLSWLGLPEVDRLAVLRDHGLHPGFARSWPALRRHIRSLREAGS